MKNSFFEYEEITNSKLKEAVNSNEALHQYFSSDFGKIKASKYCGIVQIEGQDFYILPKISKGQDVEVDYKIFTYMLMNVFDLKIENENLSGSQNQKHQIIEIFIELFAKMLFKELQRGVFKSYITEEDNLKTLRGKYLPLKDITTNFARERIYCEYDEFSENNELNQFFLFAVQTLERYTSNKKILKTIEVALGEVDRRAFDVKSVEIFFNRLNERFEKSFEIAKLLLNHFIPLFSKDKKSFAFLFDMNMLFEKFVGNLVKDLDPNVKLGTSYTFENLILKPDIITKNLIIDCKYKINNKGKVSRGDKHQMYVYGNNFEGKDTMLLYPKHLKDLIDNEFILGENEQKVVLKVGSLDLWFNSGYEEYIECMGRKIEKLTSKHLDDKMLIKEW